MKLFFGRIVVEVAGGFLQRGYVLFVGLGWSWQLWTRGVGVVRQCEDWDVVMCNDCWLY